MIGIDIALTQGLKSTPFKVQPCKLGVSERADSLGERRLTSMRQAPGLPSRR